MAVDLTAYSRLVDQISETILEPAALPAALAGLAALAGVDRAAMVQGAPDGAKKIVASAGFHPSVTEAYNFHFHHDDRLLSASRDIPVAFSAASQSPHWPEYRESAFHTQWARPNGIARIAFVNVPLTDGYQSTVVLSAAQRPSAVRAQLDLLGLLRPHFQRAAKVSAYLRDIRDSRDMLFWAMEKWPCGAVLLARDGRVRHASALAREILDQKDGLTLSPRGLRASHGETDRLLEAMVARMRRPGATPGRGVDTLAVPRPSLAHAFLVHAFPLQAGKTHRGQPEGRDLAGNQAVMLLVVDPARDAGPASDLIGAVFDLTPAETALARRMARGHGLQAVALAIGVSHATARTHLQAIFQKTGTNRQAELVRLLSRIDSGWTPGETDAGPG